MEDVENIILDLKHEFEDEDVNLVLRQTQHYDAKKISCVSFLHNKIDTVAWKNFLQSRLKSLLYLKPLLALSVSKMNYGTTCSNLRIKESRHRYS